MKYAIEMKDGTVQIMTVFEVDGVLPDPADEVAKWHESLKENVASIRPAKEGEVSSHRLV